MINRHQQQPQIITTVNHYTTRYNPQPLLSVNTIPNRHTQSPSLVINIAEYHSKLRALGL